MQCFERALSLNSQDAEALFNLGVLLSEKKKVDQALRHLGQAVNLTPGEAQVFAGTSRSTNRRQEVPGRD